MLVPDANTFITQMAEETWPISEEYAGCYLRVIEAQFDKIDKKKYTMPIATVHKVDAVFTAIEGGKHNDMLWFGARCPRTS